MATRYGNGGGRGRRISDFEDQPLTDEVSKRNGEHRGRNTVIGGAAGVTLAHAPVAVYMGSFKDAFSHSRSPTLMGTARGVPRAYHPRVLRSLVRSSPKYAAALTAGAAAGAGVGALSAGRKKLIKKSLVGSFKARKIAEIEAAHTAAHKKHLQGLARKTGRLAATGTGIAVASGALGEAHGRSVGKAARYYDPEHRRQRRLGMAEAGLLGAGAASAGLGIKGAIKTTRSLRSAQKLRPRLTGSVAARKREIAGIAGGTAAVSGAGLVREKAENRKMGIWR